MIRILPRVYLVALLLLSLGLALPGLTIWLNADYNSEVVSQIYRGQMSLAADRLREAEDFDAELVSIQERFDFDVRVVAIPSEEIPFPRVRQLRGGDVLVDLDDQSRPVAYYRVDFRRALRFGPLPALRVYGTRGAVLATGLVLLGGYLLVHLVVRPFNRQNRALAQASEAVSNGNLSVQISEQTIPDSPELVRAFNLMTTRLREILLSQRQLLQDVSHELRTPLARIRFGLEMLEEATDKEEAARRVLPMFDETVEQLDNLVGELLEYTRLADQERLVGQDEEVAIEDLVESAISRVAFEREKGIEVLTEVVRDLPTLRGNERELKRALDNLVVNALRFAKSKVQVSAGCQGEWAEITVEDDGPGIPAELREKVLEPFVQLERDHAHSGLGLAIVRRIVEGHGGEVVVDDSGRLGGASMRLRLPLDRA